MSRNICPRVASEYHQLKRIIAIVEVLGVVLPLFVNVITALLQVIRAVAGDVATLVKAVLRPVLETVGEILIGPASSWPASKDRSDS